MPTLEQVQAESNASYRRAQEHLAAVKTRRRVLEQADPWASSDPYRAPGRPGIGNAANDLFQHSGFTYFNARPGSRQHGDYPPFYRTEQDHWQILDAARLLEGLCPTAANILDVLTQFAIFTGLTYTVVPKKREGDTPEKKPSPLVTAGQDILDTFIRINDWWAWEQEIFRRSRRDGETFIYLEPDELTGLWKLRAIEPEQVKQPQDTAWLNAELRTKATMSWKYGILTPRDDTATEEGYWVVSNYNDDKNIGEYIPAEEMIHIKTEWVDRQAKRGVSDFFSVANDIHRTRKLLRHLNEGAAVQASLAWIRSHPPDMAPVRLGPHADPTNITRSGHRTSSVTYDGPTMLDVPDGMTYTAGPLGMSDKSGALIQVLQAALRNIGARWQMPEALISGDSSNANLASALVAEGPFVRAMTYRQWHYRGAFRQIMERVLEHAAATGLLGTAQDTILDQVEVNVECPPVIARKPEEETARNQILYANGILSKQSWAAREDLDFEEEKANLEEEPPDMFGELEPEQDETEPSNPLPKGGNVT